LGGDVDRVGVGRAGDGPGEVGAAGRGGDGVLESPGAGDRVIDFDGVGEGGVFAADDEDAAVREDDAGGEAAGLVEAAGGGPGAADVVPGAGLGREDVDALGLCAGGGVAVLDEDGPVGQEVHHHSAAVDRGVSAGAERDPRGGGGSGGVD